MLQSLRKLGEKFSKFLGEAPSNPLIDAFSQDTIAKILPWESYDEEHKIFISRNSLGFTVEALPLVACSESTFKELSSIFEEILDEGESIQCLLWADHRITSFIDKWKNARNAAGEVYREIAARRGQFIQDQGTSRLFRFIFSYSVEGSVESVKLDALTDKREKILKILRSYTYAFCWDINDFFKNVGSWVNFSPSRQFFERSWNPYDPIYSQFSLGRSLKIEEEHLSYDDLFLKTYRVANYPDSWSLAEMQRLIGDAFRDAFRIPVPFYLHYGVHCPKQSKEEMNSKKRMLLVEKQGKSSMLRRMIPALEEELAEIDFVRRELAQTSKFVWTQLMAGIWANSKELTSAEESLKSLFRINQFSLIENRYLQLPSYLSTMPMTWGEYANDLKELNVLRTTISSECAALMPIQGEWMGTRSEGMLLMGRRGQIANWNPFDNRSGNYNVVVVGRSGSGKSVFMQDLLLNGLGVGARVYVLEVGRSFEKLSELLSGQHIEFSNSSDIRLNPFSLISGESAEERDSDFTFIKSIIATMAAPSEGTSDYENALIERGIREAWLAKSNKATITDVSKWLQDQPDKKAQILGVMLTPYTKEGVYAKYFEGVNNVDFSNPFVLIELEELKEKKDLQSVVIQLFIMAITNRAFLGDRKTPFYICIDEAWDLLRGKQTGVFIETLARRLRKYYGSLVIGTQSVDDFYATPGALAAFENSDWMCFLSQKKSSISRFAESGKIEMDEAKQYALSSVSTRHGEYSEVMICDADGNYAIERLTLDPFSQMIYTTKAQEYSKIKELQKEGLSLVEAINYLLENVQN